jgi:hypothetical protein
VRCWHLAHSLSKIVRQRHLIASPVEQEATRRRILRVRDPPLVVQKTAGLGFQRSEGRPMCILEKLLIGLSLGAEDAAAADGANVTKFTFELDQPAQFADTPQT